MSADDARLIERSVWDASGMERIPFDGTPAPTYRYRTSTQARGNHAAGCSANPEIGCVCGYDPGEHATEPAYGYQRAGKITAGQEIAIYGGVRVTVLSVERLTPTDSFDPSTPWVKLRYQSGTYADGGPIVGQMSLPASQCLRVFT